MLCIIVPSLIYGYHFSSFRLFLIYGYFLICIQTFLRRLPLCVGNAVTHYLLQIISDKFIEGFLIIQESI